MHDVGCLGIERQRDGDRAEIASSYVKAAS